MSVRVAFCLLSFPHVVTCQATLSWSHLLCHTLVGSLAWSYPCVVACQEGLFESTVHRQQHKETQAFVSEELESRQYSGPK